MSDRADLLVEVGTEELPPAALGDLGRAFFDGMLDGLAEARLDFDRESSRWFATPRRLAVRVAGLEGRQADRETERRGPAVKAAFDDDGNPTKAAEGFARSVGAAVADLDRKATDKGEYLVYQLVEPGRTVAEILPGLLRDVLERLPTPRRMRWGAGDAAFVRPVHWLVLLHGSDVVPGEVFGISAGCASRGHRFHHPEPVELASAADYEAALEKACVVAGLAERRRRIAEQVDQAAAGLGGESAAGPGLLDEVAALTEWPVAIAGRFDRAFLALPPEVITTTLEHHQAFFPVRSKDGELTEHFVGVANLESRDPAVVRQGYERVIRPRLADARFFFEQDRRQTLAGRLPALEGMLFQKDLGTLRQKTRRNQSLAGHIAGLLGTDPAGPERAAELAKCDLVTLMVGEFPELQGTMGRYYAGFDGEDAEVARTVEEHYKPRFAGDTIPGSMTGRIVAVADKVDTLTGIFAAGLKPTGAKDPFSLRRQALGVCRILIEGELDLDLASLIEQAAAGLEGQLAVSAEVRDEVLDYCMERLRGYYADRGVSHDVFEAVLATRPTRLMDFDRRVAACRAFRALPEAAALAAANKRIRNILRQAGELDGTQVDGALVEAGEERALADAVEDKSRSIEPLMAEREYERALTELAGLRDTVDAFFDHVMVMAEDERLRRNRLALLARMNRMFLDIADVSRLDLEESQ
jgi:glycyl-tRNA synthetase beta chain